MANKCEPFVLDFPNGQRVEDILKKADQLPTKAQLDQQMASKATTSDVQRETQNLQNQIDEIVRAPESGGDVGAEVAQARVDADGVTHATLKARCDSDASKTTQLKEDLVYLDDAIFETSSVVTYVTNIKDISGVLTKEGYSASAYTDSVRLGVLSGYDSYYIIADKDFELWFDANVPANKYVAIVHGENYTGVSEHTAFIDLLSTNPVRYRNSDNNLPSEDNKLSIHAGDVVAFTFTSGYTYPIYGYSTVKVSKVSKLKSAYSGVYSLSNNTLDVIMNKAHYIFKKVTDTDINIDTWRLYKGDLIKPDGNYFKMWLGSDAEGVVQIKGEADFIGGYHGDEIMTDIRIFIDGKEISPSSEIQSSNFNEIAVYVESDVYHCNTSELADTVAFKRNKYLKFANGVVTIGNEWTAQSDLIVNSAPLSLFQCYYKENDVEVAKSYMVDADYKVYDLATPSNHTPNSKEMSLCRLETKYGSIEFKNKKTSGQKPMGVVAYNFISSQNRIKFYYYTVYGDTQIASGEKLISEFEIVIN